jgi:hypothetical protein
MPIDLGQVDWLYIGVLAVFVFIASFLANLLSFNRRGLGAVLAAVVFAAIFIFWTYYPHGAPFLPISIASQKSPASAVVPPVAATPPKPSNPVTDITPSPSTPR